MKRLMIPVGAGILALAGTVALALGPNSSGGWGLNGTEGGVLSVQRAPSVAGEQATAAAPKPAEGPEARAPTVGAEATPAAEPTPEPRPTNTQEATQEATSTPAAVTVEPKNTPTLEPTQTPKLEPTQFEPAKEQPAATKPVEPRAAQDAPAKVDHPSAPTVPKKVAEPANGTSASNTDRRP